MQSFCAKCKTNTNQKVLFEQIEHIQEEDGWQEYNFYQIIKCKGCDTISFRKLHENIAMRHECESGYEVKPLVQLYPNRSEHHLTINRYSHTPNNIRTIYKETIEAYNNSQLILCSGGLRAILEGICIDKDIKGSNVILKNGNTKFVENLQKKIEGLAEKGFLTTGNAEILHSLRFIGNDALHELSAPNKHELKLAIDIIEHTIESLYEIEFKAHNLKTKLSQRKNPNK
ncbi:DUF4145 domain-containing protein [Flavobacterium sp. UBA4197]|uniref:DUF4145 domain-containing protein n=1 Tax=Flavobacterium sp. UBA4197 TaxID=1946546 RepID=UPI00257F8DD5|nr:DUF4145 domain-containing protein [Flavobacterium sp. UBA4197]